MAKETDLVSADYGNRDIFAALPKTVARKTLNKIYERIDKNTRDQILYHSGDDRAWLLLMMIYDSTYADLTFAELCRAANLSLGDVVKMFMDYRMVAVMMAAADPLPEIVADAAYDALAKQVLCGRCDGTGEVEYMGPEGIEDVQAKKCPLCEGSGKVRAPGDREARDYVSKVAGVGREKKTPPVLIQQNIGEKAPETFEQIITTAEEITKKK